MRGVRRRAPEPGPPVPRRYEGQTVAIVASGPSARREDVEYCRARGWPVWAVNTSFRLGCNSLYGCDYRWWKAHHAEAKQTTLDCWAWSQRAAEEFGLRWIRGVAQGGFSEIPDRLHDGRNSGYQCLNLVYLMGAARVLLVGFDMRHVDGQTHHHGDHPKGLANPKAAFLAECAGAFDTIQPLPRCEVLNCTPGSAIRRFPIVALRSLV